MYPASWLPRTARASFTQPLVDKCAFHNIPHFTINYIPMRYAGIVSPPVSPDHVPCRRRGEWVGWTSEWSGADSGRRASRHLTFYGQVKSYDYMPLLSSSSSSSLIHALYLASAARAFVLRWYISLLSLVSAKVVANPTKTRLSFLRCLSVSLIGSGNCCPLSFHFR